MPRKLRLEYPGAFYHVINRGNYRSDIFATAGARASFTSCLGEACRKSGWRLHAYVLMRNHYHLALETPKGNLVAGMQWLQATFANKFNRIRGERGHLFQGRYKALLVEPGAHLGQLCHYLHLNPVRAGVATVGKLKDYRDSSYWQLWHPAERSAGLVISTALAHAGGLADTVAGRQAYEKFLAWQSSHGPAGRNQAYVSMSRGWILASKGFKETLLKEHAPSATSRAWETAGKAEIQQARWTKLFDSARKTLGRNAAELGCPPAAQAWKIALMLFMKDRSQASNAWLADQFCLTRPKYVSRLVWAARRLPPSTEWLQLCRE